jgi:electron transport complex protein RnfA
MTGTLQVLLIFSVLSFNLVLQLGLHVRDTYIEQNVPSKHTLKILLLLFVTELVLWLFCNYVLASLSIHALQYFLIYPLIVLLFKLYEKFYTMLLITIKEKRQFFKKLSSYTGTTLIAVLLMLYFASGFLQALILCTGFLFGMGAASVLIWAIRKRTAVEIIPRPLRGVPVFLISLGLLALVFSSITNVLLK